MPARLSSMGHSFSLLIAVAFATSAIACGPDVVGGHGNSGGAGGTTGGGASAGATPTAGAAGGTSTCAAQGLIGDIDSCPFDVPGGCGDWTLCDAVENQFRSNCTEAGCECILNASVICTCTFDISPCKDVDVSDPGACCAQLNDSGCCPYPWLHHVGCKGTGESCNLNADCCKYLCTSGTCDP